MKVKVENLKKVILLFAVFILILFIACDDFKSQEFQISDLDGVACAQLSDTVFSTLSLKTLTEFDTIWVDSVVTDHVSEILDSLEANDIVLLADGSEAIQIETTGADTNYFALRINFGSIIWYSDESITVNLITEANQIQRTSDASMPPETVSGCTMLEDDKPVPLIRTRMKYGTSDDRYLVMIIKDDQTRSNSIKISILRNQ